MYTPVPEIKNLFIVKPIKTYGEDGLVAMRFKVGTTIKGSWDGLIGGYRCKTDDGVPFMVFYDEVVVC